MSLNRNLEDNKNGHFLVGLQLPVSLQEDSNFSPEREKTVVLNHKNQERNQRIDCLPNQNAFFSAFLNIPPKNNSWLKRGINCPIAPCFHLLPNHGLPTNPEFPRKGSFAYCLRTQTPEFQSSAYWFLALKSQSRLLTSHSLFPTLFSEERTVSIWWSFCED